MQLTVNRKRPGLITQKEICSLWGVCIRTFQKERSRWGLTPEDFDGLMPLFKEDDVRAADDRRKAARLARYV